jgi:hypothetical protein
VSGNQLSLVRDLFRHHSASSAWCRSRYCHKKKAPPASTRMKTCFQGFIDWVRTGWKVWLFAPSLSFGGRFCATCRLESAHEFHTTPSKLQQLPARRVRAPDSGRFADGVKFKGSEYLNISLSTAYNAHCADPRHAHTSLLYALA